MRPIRLAHAALLASACALGETKLLKEEIPAAPGQTLVFENLAGRVRVTGAPAGPIRIEGTVHAEDPALLGSVTFEVKAEGERTVVHTRYPTEKIRTFHYPDPRRDGPGFVFAFDLSSSTVEYQGRRVTVTTGRKRGEELYVDAILRVPAGVSVEVENAAGRVDSRDVAGTVTISAKSGDVGVWGSGDTVRINTGSGDIDVDDVRAGVSVKTGSGDVKVSHVKGAVSIDTGSGDVKLVDVTGGVKTHTGSGTVVLEKVRGSLEHESGSGDFAARDLRLEGRLSVETGSGDVELSGDAAALTGALVDVSSGNVRWRMSGAPALDLEVVSSSGEIDLDLPGITYEKRKDGRVEARTGEGGVPVKITTSSGDVRLSR